MRPRDPHEPHRVASSLELFFDLVFVVAVSIASVELHHSLQHGEVVSGMDVVRKIKKGSSANNGAVNAPDKIVRMRLLADAK